MTNYTYQTIGISGADYVAPTPIINSVVPNCGSTLGGTTITITSDLNGFLATGNVITIDGVAPRSITSESTSQVVVVTESGAGQGDIVVNSITAVNAWSYVATPSTPEAPISTLSNVLSDSLKLNWTFESFVDYYKIQRKKDLGSWEYTGGEIQDTSYLDTNLTPESTYQYKVEAYNDSGFSTSNIVNVVLKNYGVEVLAWLGLVDTIENGSLASFITTFKFNRTGQQISAMEYPFLQMFVAGGIEEQFIAVPKLKNMRLNIQIHVKVTSINYEQETDLLIFDERLKNAIEIDLQNNGSCLLETIGDSVFNYLEDNIIEIIIPFTVLTKKFFAGNR